jgi:hypothetical protein
VCVCRIRGGRQRSTRSGTSDLGRIGRQERHGRRVEVVGHGYTVNWAVGGVKLEV